jgi:hypothetical protein
MTVLKDFSAKCLGASINHIAKFSLEKPNDWNFPGKLGARKSLETIGIFGRSLAEHFAQLICEEFEFVIFQVMEDSFVNNELLMSMKNWREII